MNNHQQKLEYLVALNYEISHYDNETIAFDDDNYYGYEITFNDFEVGDSSADILDKATWYSPCCGELLDKDHMRCPECQESC